MRRHALRDALPATARLLADRRAPEVRAGFIDDYLALRWLEPCGNSLRLTLVGEDICRQIASR